MTCRNGTACVSKVHVKSNTRMCDFCQVSRANRGHSLCGSCCTQWSTRTSLPHWNEDGDATPARGARCIVYHGTSFSSARTIVRTRHFNARIWRPHVCCQEARGRWRRTRQVSVDTRPRKGHSKVPRHLLVTAILFAVGLPPPQELVVHGYRAS